MARAMQMLMHAAQSAWQQHARKGQGPQRAWNTGVVTVVQM